MNNMTKINFNQKPDCALDYVFGAQINRENFTSFLILSFAVSRGHPEIQRVFFIWLEKIHSFEYSNVLKEFVSHGAFDAFSAQEQKIFTDAFMSVKRHSESFDQSEFEDEMREELIALYKRPVNVNVMEVALKFFDLVDITSIGDFTKSASDYIRVHKSKKQ
jgi:hypothetical protein